MEPELYKALRTNDLAGVRECLQAWGKGNRRLWWTGTKRAPTPLHVAIKSSRYDILQELLRHPEISCAINTFTAKASVTPLHEAAASSSPEVIRLLIQAGADLTLLSGDRSTAFHIACSRGRLETCAELLRQGSALEGRDGESMTPLLRATVAGRADVTKWLISEGANIAAVDSTNSTPLAVCCYVRDLDVARLLLDAGARVVAKNAAGRICAHLSVLAGKSGLLRLMLEAMAVSGERFEDGGGDMLFDAAYGGLPDAVNLLTSARGIDLGIEVNRPNKEKEGNTALHAACFRGQLDVVGMLLSRGAAPDSTDEIGLTPLHIACATPDSLPTVKALLDSNANVNVVDALGYPPLYYAFIRGNDEIVRYILSRGANLFRMDYDQALRIACFYGLTVAVESLLWMEADQNSIARNQSDRGATFHRSIKPDVRNAIYQLLAENSSEDCAGETKSDNGDTFAAKAAAEFGERGTETPPPGCATDSTASSTWTSDENETSMDGGYHSLYSGHAEDDAMVGQDDDIGDDDAFVVPSMCVLDRVLERRKSVGSTERCGGTGAGAEAVVKRWGQRFRGVVIKGRKARGGAAGGGKRGGLAGVADLARAKIAGAIRWASTTHGRKAGGAALRKLSGGT